MSQVAPTTADIDAQIIAQLDASLSTAIPLLPKAFLRVLSKTLAGVFILLYKYAGFIFLQVFVKTATIEDVLINGVVVSPLKEWGRLTGVGDPNAATQAEFDVLIIVENQVGQLEPGTQLLNVDNGVTYILQGVVLLDAPTKIGTVRAAADQGGGNGAGTIGNLEIGDVVSFANPIANVARDTTVDTLITTGADQEDTEVYRQRILDRFQKRPAGGALIDYEIWGEGVAGILNIYPYTGTQPGRVDVFVESATEVDGIPTAPQLQAVFDAIELDDAGLASRRPANAFVNVFAITRESFDVSINGVSDIDGGEQAQLTTDLTNAIQSFLLDREPFISGVTVTPRRDKIAETEITGVIADIISAANGTFSAATVGFTPIDTGIGVYTLARGEKAKGVTVSVSYV